METTKHDKLAQALSGHKFEQRFSVGTAAIVESLHKDFGHSYEQIAEIANVSTAGVRRWRERNIGDRSRFEPLLKYAERIASGDDEKSVSVPASGGASSKARQDQLPAQASESMRPLTIQEAKLGLSMMFGVEPDQVEIHIRG